MEGMSPEPYPEKDQPVLDVVDSLELDSRMSSDGNSHGVYNEGLNLRVAAEGFVGNQLSHLSFPGYIYIL